MRQQRAPPELRDDDRHDDVKHDRQQQRVPGHGDRREAEQQSDNRREGDHHDGVIEGDLRQREMRLALHEVRPDEDHGRAGSRRQQDQSGDIAVDLVRRQEWPEQMRDEYPAEQRHGEGLHQPVNADRHRDSAPMLLDLPKRAKVDLEQHRDNHEPDQHGDRQIDLGDRRRANGVEDGGYRLTEDNARDDAERDPERQVTLEDAHGGRFAGLRRARESCGFTHGCSLLEGSGRFGDRRGQFEKAFHADGFFLQERHDGVAAGVGGRDLFHFRQLVLGALA